MSREFKFRAWDKSKNKMIFGPTDNNPNASWILALKPLGFPIMQSTGFTDSDYTDVYEGDIIQSNEFTHLIEVVEWKENMWTEEGYMTGFGDFRHPLSEYTIIGNIYKNPELIP
jgi:hypothetical protein